jgi:hypothetical protein
MAGPGSVSCTGTIIVTFTWVPDDAADLPPDYVVIKKQSSAGWSGESGSASNGLGDMCIPGNWSGVSSGTHYELRPEPGQSFEIPIEPSANGTLPWWSFAEVECATASVEVTFSAHPLEIESLYAVKTGEAFNFLIGQQADFYVTNGANVTLEAHVWTPGLP